MGNIPEKQSAKSSSVSSLNRSYSSPARHRRSSSSDSPRRPSRQNKDSLRRKVFRNSNGRASNPDISFGQSSPIKNLFLTSNQRDLIKGNWDQHKRFEVCRRIYSRAFGKRPDVRSIFERPSEDHLWHNDAEAFANFLQLIVENLDDFSIVRRVALDFGRRHGEWRRYGFKSEFWVTLAEAMTKECVYLDAALHPPGEVLEAWSKLVGFIFGWIRDGYYENLRLQRQLSRKVQPSLSPTNTSTKSIPARLRACSLVNDAVLTDSRSRKKLQSPLANRRATLCVDEAMTGRRGSNS